MEWHVCGFGIFVYVHAGVYVFLSQVEELKYIFELVVLKDIYMMAIIG